MIIHSVPYAPVGLEWFLICISPPPSLHVLCGLLATFLWIDVVFMVLLALFEIYLIKELINDVFIDF